MALQNGSAVELGFKSMSESPLTGICNGCGVNRVPMRSTRDATDLIALILDPAISCFAVP